ncbi:hypothetical protein PG993_007308 [Apiospora rasikravindrae]|uniref:Glucose receptor Git3-like N-terminal domain-containing protein n=1 Tax=Apiospora rasikravindrae TaxID=990691 RepID=A0ABR1SX45_9PEZI
MGWVEHVAGPTLVLSLLSSLATGLVLMIWLSSAAKPMVKGGAAEKNALREALVLNLMISEFINSTNNSVSGVRVVTSHIPISKGPLCSLNGWTGQVTVQASDFSIFAIVLVTFLTFNYQTWPMRASRLVKFSVCLSIWIIPLTTGTIALALNEMEPASGNWCWIAGDPPYLRYVLGHGWRFAIFIIIIGIYLYIFIKVMLRVRTRKRTNSRSAQLGRPKVREISWPSATIQSAKDLEFQMSSFETSVETPSREEFAIRPSNPRTNSQHPVAGTDNRRHHFDTELRHWLVLSIYPLTYMLVWIPGLANRLVELQGDKSQLLSVLQATTQLTGFINALCYGFKELHGRVQKKQNVNRSLDEHYNQRWGFTVYRELS